MNYNEFKNKIIEYTKIENIKEYELYYSSGQSTSIKAYEQEIDSFDYNTSVFVNFRCKNNGKIGYSYTESLSDEEAKRLIVDAKRYSTVLNENPYQEIYKGGKPYNKIDSTANIDRDNIDFLKKTALEIEKRALALDNRVKNVEYAIADYTYSEKALYNSFGLDLHNANSYYGIMCYTIAEDETGRKYTGYEFQNENDKNKLDVDRVTKNAVKETLAYIGAKNILSDEYPILFSNKMSVEIIGAFKSILSSDAVQKGLSLLKEKEGEIIASDTFSLIEDPFTNMSVVRTYFDDEGYPTSKKQIIENGRLNTFIYNMETAKKADKESTGNARLSGSMGVGFSNLYVKPGKKTLEELAKKTGTGIYITELKGMHASADSTSGDFSLESKGFFIEDGKISYPVEQFTIAGNFYSMLKNIVDVADDICFEGTTGAPSILVSKLTVSGK